MRVIINSNYDEMSIWAANYVAQRILDANPTPERPFVLGCPTGSSPLGLYKHLVELNKRGVISFKNVVTFNMDEYVGLDVNHPESYHSFMWNNFFNHIDIKKENVHILDGNAPDLIAECNHYEEMIEQAGGIDLFMGGIGVDGHIAFNEPAESFQRWSHVVELKESTIKDNSRFFDNINDVPTRAVTMGIGSIMQAKRILIIALGEHKAKAIKQLIDGNVTPSCPASVLQFHTDVTLMLDKGAASLI